MGTNTVKSYNYNKVIKRKHHVLISDIGARRMEPENGIAVGGDERHK